MPVFEPGTTTLRYPCGAEWERILPPKIQRQPRDDKIIVKNEKIWVAIIVLTNFHLRNSHNFQKIILWFGSHCSGFASSSACTMLARSRSHKHTHIYIHFQFLIHFFAFCFLILSFWFAATYFFVMVECDDQTAITKYVNKLKCFSLLNKMARSQASEAKGDIRAIKSRSNGSQITIIVPSDPQFSHSSYWKFVRVSYTHKKKTRKISAPTILSFTHNWHMVYTHNVLILIAV